ncbi:aminoglycoside phosphotransferase family protein [Legionella cardiaca]|uniref:Aminoglycoside phosphotransferase family protein n=1 Tax=Legionella cardiaca TaxID=1071983 RepID=A0ABY8AMY9_9GAMM|nr:aminoglycoside phosphotransferase family protein [Legionella cardiaca]WED42064.1 aminoglycoside phosphotransferase family protein [Legionella cardiaca]
MLKTEELKYISDEFGLMERLQVIKPLASGDVNSAYQVACGSQKYVIKKINKERYVKDYSVELDKLTQSLLFSEQIAAQLSETNHVRSAFFTGTDCIVQTKNELILLYPYLDAIALENHSLSTDHVKDIAEFLYQLHHCQLSFDHDFAKKKFEIYKQLGEKIINLSVWNRMSSLTHPGYFFPTINAIANYLLANKGNLLHALENMEGTVLCHNDLKPKNVLWKENYFWVVDWETVGLFDQAADYLDSLLAWCTLYNKDGVSMDQGKLRVFMEAYPLPEQANLAESLNIVLIKWYFWLAFCLNKLVKNPKKFKSNFWHIRYSINFIVFLINGKIISQIENTHSG